MIKNTNITKRFILQFRAEDCSFITQENFLEPNTSFVWGVNGINISGSFGVIASAKDPWLMQLEWQLLF
jgi:hypothetical protein